MWASIKIQLAKRNLDNIIIFYWHKNLRIFEKKISKLLFTLSRAEREN